MVVPGIFIRTFTSSVITKDNSSVEEVGDFRFRLLDTFQRSVTEGEEEAIRNYSKRNTTTLTVEQKDISSTSYEDAVQEKLYSIAIDCNIDTNAIKGYEIKRKNGDKCYSMNWEYVKNGRKCYACNYLYYTEKAVFVLTETGDSKEKKTIDREVASMGKTSRKRS